MGTLLKCFWWAPTTFFLAKWENYQYLFVEKLPLFRAIPAMSVQILILLYVSGFVFLYCSHVFFFFMDSGTSFINLFTYTCKCISNLFSWPGWLIWIRVRLWSGGCRFDPHWAGNILSQGLIIKYFLRSFSPFCWFRKGMQLSVSGERMGTVLVNCLED